MIITYINSTYDPGKFSLIKLDDALTKIRDGTFKSSIERYRSMPEGKEKKEAKKKLSSFAFNGTFKDRVINDNFLSSSGLFHFDIDHLDDPESDKLIISSYPGIVFLFTSTSGSGLKGAIRVTEESITSDADFKKTFAFFERSFKQRGYTIDASRKDVRSLCFISHDPDLFYNPDAEPVSTNDNSIEGECVAKLVRILQKASNGDRHAARLRASNLAGGYIAGGLLEHDKARDILLHLSDVIADGGQSSSAEIKTIDDGIRNGMLRPIESVEKLDSYEVQDWNPNLSSEIDYIIPFPGLARDIQAWILQESIYPQPSISFAATMSILSVSIGRYVAFENIKGNLMFLCMAESGEGKDWPFKCAKYILNEVGLGEDVYEQMASGAALIESLVDSPSMLFHVDEFGNYLASINNKNSSQYSREIVDIMTKSYTSADSEISGKKTKGNSPLKISEPNLCVFGMSTERQVFDGLRTSDLANGSLARYSLLFGVNGQLPRNITPNRNPPESIINGLRELIDKHKKAAWPYSAQIERSDDYKNEKFRIMTDIKKMTNVFSAEDSAFTPMYGRVAVRCIQQAMLIDQCQSIDVLQWLEKMELASVKLFKKKFLHLGADNEDERQAKLLQSKIKESGKNGISAAALTRSTQQVKPHIREATLAEWVRHGIIAKEGKKIEGRQRETTFYYWIK